MKIVDIRTKLAAGVITEEIRAAYGTRRHFEWKDGRVAFPTVPGLGVVPVNEKVEQLKRNVGRDPAFDHSPGSRFIPTNRSIQV